jgi:hypothetical protein
MDSEKHFAILFLFSRLAEFEKQRIGGDICNKYHYLVSELKKKKKKSQAHILLY